RFHEVPFHLMISVSSRWPVKTCPTAQALVPEVPATANSSPSVLVGVTVHEVPSQCSMRMCSTSLPLVKLPTAQMSRAEMTRSPLSALLSAGLGLSTWVQDVPSECRMRVCPLVPNVLPTAQMFVGETARTLLRSTLTLGGCGGT